MELNEANKLKKLEKENTELKIMLADAMLAKRVMEYALKKCKPGIQKSCHPIRSRRRHVFRAFWVSNT